MTSFLHRGLWSTQEAPAALRHKRLHENCWGFHKRAILDYHILWFCCVRCAVLLPLSLIQHYFESERARIALCQSKLLLCNTISRHVKVKKSTQLPASFCRPECQTRLLNISTSPACIVIVMSSKPRLPMRIRRSRIHTNTLKL